MNGLAAYADALGVTPQSAPVQSTPAGLGAYADALGVARPQKTAPATQQEAKFQTNDPAEMRKQIAATGDPALLAVFDRQFPGMAPKTAQAPQPQDVNVDKIPSGVNADGSMKYPQTKPAAQPLSVWQKVVDAGKAYVGAHEAALSLASGGIPAQVGGALSVVNNIGGTLANIATGNTEALKGRETPEQAYSRGAEALTYAPRTQAGSDIVGGIADAMNASGAVALAPMSGALATAASKGAQAAKGAKSLATTSMEGMREAFATKATPVVERTEPTLSTKPLYRRVDGQWQQVKNELLAPEAAPIATVAFDSEPVRGGLPKQLTPDRAEVLKRVGLEDARTSAVMGDAATAARDYQLTKFDEAAGNAAKAQFAAEKQALDSHAQGIIKDTKGSFGLDEDALNNRGQVISKPFDGLRQWFDNKTSELYKEAENKSQGLPSVKTEELDQLLSDRSFKNQLTATNQNHVLNGVADELQRFKETNPQGLTVANAEQFRQFLNTLWTKDTAPIIGKMKTALDQDVFKGAGDDVYAQARKMHQLQKQTLDNPSGVAKLMDFDPQTPINRVTDFNKIPDTMARLGPAQFSNLVETLKKMPPELQPQAQQALAEVKAHLANKIYAAGTKNTGADASWNAPAVSKILRDNSAKIQAVFSPEEIAKITDLQAAGNILRVDQSYPGAAAQAQNAMKRGLMSRITQKTGSFVGGGIGSVFGPVGAAAGAATGEAVGAKMGTSMAEQAALKKWQSGVTKLNEVGK